MDSFEFNKVAGAVLGTCLFAMAVGVLSDAIFENHPPEEPGYAIAIPDAEHPEDGGTAAPKAEPLPVLLASASASDGEGATRPCQACHTFDKGGANKVGPNLWNVVGGPVLSHPDFNYSSGMKEWGADKSWTYANLDAFLANPRGTVKGTAMSFAGIKNDKQRADVLVYLRSLSDSPVALPEVEKTAAADTGTATDASPEGAAAPAATEGGKDAAPAAADPQKDAAAQGTTQTAAADAGTQAAPAGGADAFVQMVASANPDDGKRGVRACQACHSFEKGGPTKVGPNLWNVVNQPIIHGDYNYSKAMQEFGADKTWTYDLLDTYLAAPMKVVPGTKMAFAGVKKEEDRASIVAYMRTLSDSPAPLPGAAQ
jgi:cytochrome c2